MDQQFCSEGLLILGTSANSTGLFDKVYFMKIVNIADEQLQTFTKFLII